jgi:hypothetical protein
MFLDGHLSDLIHKRVYGILLPKNQYGNKNVFYSSKHGSFKHTLIRYLKPECRRSSFFPVQECNHCTFSLRTGDIGGSCIEGLASIRAIREILSSDSRMRDWIYEPHDSDLIVLALHTKSLIFPNENSR